MRTKQILLVDDLPMVREWLTAVIARESDLLVCGSAHDLVSALPLAQKLGPDLVIVDIAMKDSRGANAVAALRASNKQLTILVFSRLDDELNAEVAIRSGASGFVNHRCAGGEVIAAIRKVLGGGVCLREGIGERILTHIAQGSQRADRALNEVLSPRELCVFELLGEGYRPAEVAKKMTLSISTVEGYIARIECKLDVSTSRELVRQAITWMRTRHR